MLPRDVQPRGGHCAQRPRVLSPGRPNECKTQRTDTDRGPGRKCHQTLRASWRPTPATQPGLSLSGIPQLAGPDGPRAGQHVGPRQAQLCPTLTQTTSPTLTKHSRFSFSSEGKFCRMLMPHRTTSPNLQPSLSCRTPPRSPTHPAGPPTALPTHPVGPPRSSPHSPCRISPPWSGPSGQQ